MVYCAAWHGISAIQPQIWKGGINALSKIYVYIDIKNQELCGEHITHDL